MLVGFYTESEDTYEEPPSIIGGGSPDGSDLAILWVTFCYRMGKAIVYEKV